MFRKLTSGFTFLSLMTVLGGCSGLVHTLAEAKEGGDKMKGLTVYVGGAGPIGHVGSWDVPAGLEEGGYEGYVRVFPWQGWTHAGDQLNLGRNLNKGKELAALLQDYRNHYEHQHINLIALSAGTGVTTFALEALPDEFQVDTVLFLGCSMSSRYDLTEALRHVRRGLYVLHSEDDPILRNVVWYTGTVDRNRADAGIAGLQGFHLPYRSGGDTLRQYEKLHNIAYRPEFEDVGYEGRHTDTTSRDFIRAYVAPLLLGDQRALVGSEASTTRRADVEPVPAPPPKGPEAREPVVRKPIAPRPKATGQPTSRRAAVAKKEKR